MTNFAPNDLLPVLRSFEKALKSFDVRTVATCSSPGEDWQNLITSILLSDKNLEEVKVEHTQLPNIRNEEFVVFYKALPFDYEIFARARS